jgi:hypothetical protein
MTKLIQHHQKNNLNAALRRRSFLGQASLMSLPLTAWLAGCSTHPESSEKRALMYTRKPTLWQAIKALSNSGLTREGVSQALATSLSEMRRTQHTIFFEGTEVALDADLKIAKIDLRLKLEDETNPSKTPPKPGFLVLEMSGPCVFLDEVKEKYEALQITDIPRGRSVNEATTHTSIQPWGSLSFGFKEDRPKCLAFVAFAPNKAL